MSLAVLLTCLGLIRVGLYHQGWIAEAPRWYFLPVWFSLSFGPAIFYAVKFRLFPAYRLRGTDLKHFLFPVIQLLFFVWFLFISDRAKTDIFEHYVLERYKFFEALLFTISWFTYLVMSYRYIKYRIAMTRKFYRPTEGQKLLSWKRLVKVLFVIGVINTTFITADFVAYNFMTINLYDLSGFAFWSDLSYALIPATLVWFNFRRNRILKKDAIRGNNLGVENDL